MNELIKQALSLRAAGQLKESNKMLVAAVNQFPDHAIINYQCAWSYDALGKERQAVPFYEKAIALRLPDDDLKGAIIGLGSTYRTLGEYEKSREVLERGCKLFPHDRAIQVFYALTLYNLKQYPKAMELLLRCLTETSTDESVMKYKRAIDFYSDKLDQKWN